MATMQESNRENVQPVTLTEEDKKNMRAFLKDLYHQNPSIVDEWDMNPKVFDIVREMIAAGGICSDDMEWVPKVTDVLGAKGIKATKEILRAIAKRASTDRFTDFMTGKKSLDFKCKASISRGYRTALEMAGTNT
jgi:hypothetical protein